MLRSGGMNNRVSTRGVGAVLAALILAEACTQSGPPNLPPNTDAASADTSSADAPSADLPTTDVARVDAVLGTGACLDPRQLDSGQPATFVATGCQHAMAGGRMLAVFTWTNRTGQAQTAPYGPANHVSPGSDAQGQPAWFPIGGSASFAVPFDGSLATWSVLGQSVTASQASPDCGLACSYLQLAGPDGFLVDTCTHACGDGVCDDVESCQSCPADCDCSSLVPLVDCVIPLDSGEKLVSFGYNNRGSAGGGIEIGPDNQFLPGQPARGQPVHFQVGEHHSVFQVTYGGPDVTWMLAGNTVAVSPDAPLCSQTCGSCPTGTTCVADQCQGSCGDGLCVEGCGDCPDDCACPGNSVCLGATCGTPPACGGVGMECGTSDTFGVHVDCGPCPDGQGCSNNLCQHLCPIDG
jgi:hypothetical protein